MTKVLTTELSLDEAIKAAQEWQENSEVAIPAEIVTGLVDGAVDLKETLRAVRICLLPDMPTDMRPSLASITRAKELIRAALNPRSQANKESK